jgi:hypothetical protein
VEGENDRSLWFDGRDKVGGRNPAVFAGNFQNDFESDRSRAKYNER